MGDGGDDRAAHPRPVRRPALVLRWVRRAWAAPWSAIGLLLSLSFRSRRIARDVVVAEGATWPRRLGWNYRAITFGHVVLCVDDVDERLLDHEMIHVAQYERWGPLFVPAYLVASLVTRLRGRRPYIDNPFEVAARASSEAGPQRSSAT